KPVSSSFEIRILDFEFVSDFDIRISDLSPVLVVHWILTQLWEGRTSYRDHDAAAFRRGGLCLPLLPQGRCSLAPYDGYCPGQDNEVHLAIPIVRCSVNVLGPRFEVGERFGPPFFGIPRWAGSRVF